MIRAGMVRCGECGKDNGLDGNFCRSCGHPLGADLLAEAKAENDKLVTEGFKLLSEGRLDEAQMIAGTAAENDPSNAQALSLKADCLERSGDIVGALSLYEKVVELQPDSALDRIKLDHVRKVLSQPVPAIPNKKRALGAAVAAMMLIGSVGTLGAIYISGQNAKNTKSAVGKPVASNFDPVTGTNEVQTDPVTGRPLAPEVSRAEYERLLAQQQAGQASGNTNQTPATSTSSNNNPRLPEGRTNGGMEPMEGDVAPLRPDVTIQPLNTAGNNNSRPATNTNQGSRQDPDPTPSNSQSTNSNNGSTTSRPNPGTIDIRPSNGGGSSVAGGSQPINDSPTTAREMLAKARSLYTAGDFAKAADAYESAIRMGADPSVSNQRLGQCYQKLGRKSDAARAYQNAINAYERRVQNSPDDAAAKTGLEACKSALASL